MLDKILEILAADALDWIKFELEKRVGAKHSLNIDETSLVGAIKSHLIAAQPENQ